MSYQEKYLKYKNKYLELKKSIQIGGANVGDTIVNFDNPNDEWGVIVSDEGDVYKLNTGRIAKKQTENLKWKIKFVNKHEQKEQEKQEKYAVIAAEVKRQNEDAEYTDIELKKNVSNFYIFQLTWKAGGFHYLEYPDGSTKYQDTKKVRCKMVNARSREDAFSIALIGENPVDRKYIICKLVGKSYINESKVLLEDAHYTNP